MALGAFTKLTTGLHNELSSSNIIFRNSAGNNETKEFAGKYNQTTSTNVKDPVGTTVLSVGNAGAERQIQNVAAGRITGIQQMRLMVHSFIMW